MPTAAYVLAGHTSNSPKLTADIYLWCSTSAMITISNETCTATFLEKGAELRSLRYADTEYMWQAGEAWPKTSPILFPIVGTLKNGHYLHKGVPYQLGRHGFAREREFVVTEQTGSCVCFTLMSDDDTLKHFPFPFRLDIIYSLEKQTLHISYRVVNTGTSTMYFSIGGHPAFRVPLEDSLDYEDYALHFNQLENAKRYPISPDGLIMKEPVTCLDQTQLLPLKKSLFYKDALVFKQLQSDQVSLKTGRGNRGLTAYFAGFPYMGIWAVKDADFVCIEPWRGIADGVDAGGEISDKEGIMILQAQGEWEQGWSIELF